ncbi:hypothetical protein D3C74_505900 [compost metagenome]
MRGYAENPFEMSVQMGQIDEAAVSHGGIDVFVFLQRLAGMLDLAVQEKLIR